MERFKQLPGMKKVAFAAVLMVLFLMLTYVWAQTQVIAKLTDLYLKGNLTIDTQLDLDTVGYTAFTNALTIQILTVCLICSTAIVLLAIYLTKPSSTEQNAKISNVIRQTRDIASTMDKIVQGVVAQKTMLTEVKGRLENLEKQHEPKLTDRER